MKELMSAIIERVGDDTDCSSPLRILVCSHTQLQCPNIASPGWALSCEFLDGCSEGCLRRCHIKDFEPLRTDTMGFAAFTVC